LNSKPFSPEVAFLNGLTMGRKDERERGSQSTPPGQKKVWPAMGQRRDSITCRTGGGAAMAKFFKERMSAVGIQESSQLLRDGAAELGFP